MGYLTTRGLSAYMKQTTVSRMQGDLSDAESFQSDSEVH